MYYVGLMAGTSFDGIDAALIDDDNHLIASYYHTYPSDIVATLKSIISQKHSLATVANLDVKLANLFAQAACELMAKSTINIDNIKAIGSHGQTIYHAPRRYSWQIAHPAIIANISKKIVVADFRMNDIANSGEGAPLTPLYHQYLLGNKDGVVINLGGISNITIVKDNKLSAYDIGPANTLMDAWINQHQNKPYDRDGLWAKSGKVIPVLLQQLLADDYFQKPPPKSSGFEYFNLNWLNKFLTGNESSADVQKTLLALTANSIKNAIPKNLPVYLCGGGASNKTLIQSLKKLCNNPVTTTSDLGAHPDFVEAAAFGFFAKQTLAQKPSNHPATTGAIKASILGGIYHP